MEDMDRDAILAAFDEIAAECRAKGPIPTAEELYDYWESHEQAVVLANVEAHRYDSMAHLGSALNVVWKIMLNLVPLVK